MLDFDFTLLGLVFMRMSGCILFNPIFGRRNLPVIWRIGLTILLTIFTYNLLPEQTVEARGFIVFGVLAAKELLVGFIIGYIIQLFLSVIILSGEVMDLQIGISMSKIYDPQSNVSMPVTASMLNIMLMLIFFAVNGHITMIQIFVELGQMIPYGEFAINPNLFGQLTALFSNILIYAVKMSLPVLAVGIVTEMSIGLLMKAVPQINVFVVNLQLKILVGFIVIVALVPTFASFLERLITLMFDQIQYVFRALS